MKRRIVWMGIFVFFGFIKMERGNCEIPFPQRVHAGIAAGFGLPSNFYSRFRSPISVLGGGLLNYRVANAYVLQVDGYGLYTFNLGTIDGRGGELRFNLLWTSLDLLRSMKRAAKGESFVAGGVGAYHLSQQFDANETIVNTAGFQLGLVDWRQHARWRSVVEIRWHLLFRPTSNPQVLTVTFGVLL